MTSSSNPTASFHDDQGLISIPEREYFRAQTQREAYNVIIERFSEISSDHLTLRSHLAKRLGKDRAQITRLLSEPSNITLDTLSDLLLAMGSQVEMSQRQIGSAAKGNYTHPNSVHIIEAKNSHNVELKLVKKVGVSTRFKGGDVNASSNKTAKLEFS